MDQTAAIKDMMDAIGNGKHSEVQDKFNAIMMDRSQAAVEAHKEVSARGIFNNPDAEEIPSEEISAFSGEAADEDV